MRFRGAPTAGVQDARSALRWFLWPSAELPAWAVWMSLAARAAGWSWWRTRCPRWCWAAAVVRRLIEKLSLADPLAVRQMDPAFRRLSVGTGRRNGNACSGSLFPLGFPRLSVGCSSVLEAFWHWDVCDALLLRQTLGLRKPNSAMAMPADSRTQIGSPPGRLLRQKLASRY